MMKFKNCNNESGMALVFAVGLLALLLLIGMAFVGNAVNYRRVAENNSARSQSRMFALSAVSRAALSLMVYSHQFAKANGGNVAAENLEHIYSYGKYSVSGQVSDASGALTFTDGLLGDHSKMALQGGYNPFDALATLEKYNDQFRRSSDHWPGNWVFFTNGQSGSDRRIIGRAAWQVVGSPAQLSASVFMRGHLATDAIDTTNGIPSENRWGREIDEVYIDSADSGSILHRVSDDDNGIDENTVLNSYDSIYTALFGSGVSPDPDQMQWIQRWFIHEPEDGGDVLEPAKINGGGESYSGLSRFNISELGDGHNWKNNYGTTALDQWYARFGISSAADSNGDTAINRLTEDGLEFRDGVDYEDVNSGDYNGLPFLRRIGTAQGTFADLATLRKQIAANFNDYCDSDGVPTSNVAADRWISEFFGKTAGTDGKYQHPAYTGNEKTPYLYELGMNFALIPKDTAVKNMIPTTKDASVPNRFLIDADLRLAPIFRLCNMYPFDPAESSASGVLYKDFAANEFLRGYADFDKMTMKFKLRKIRLKNAKFTYTVKIVTEDNSTTPATSNTETFNRTLNCDVSVILNGTDSEVTILPDAISYQGDVWKRAGAADADGTDTVKPLIFSGDDVKNDTGSKPYPVKYTAAADDQAWQKLEYKKENDADPGFVIDHAFLIGDLFTENTTGGLVYECKTGVELDNVTGGSVDELTKPEESAGKTRTISDFILTGFDSLQIEKIQLTNISLALRRMILTANAPLAGTDSERGIDYAGCDPTVTVSGEVTPMNEVKKDDLTLDIDLTAAAEVFPGFVMSGFRSIDPRQNLNQADWRAVSNVAVLANYANPTADEVKNVMRTSDADGERVNTNAAGNKLTPHNPLDGTGVSTHADQDSELADEPGHRGTGDNERVSTAVIRNAPMMSPWEIGFIHRGVEWQTINLKGSEISSPHSEHGGSWTAGGSNYEDGDAAILEQVKMTDQMTTYGKINVNKLTNSNPYDQAILKALFQNIYHGEYPYEFIKNSTRDTNGMFPAANRTGTAITLAGATAVAGNFTYDRSKIGRVNFINFADGSGNGLENAFGGVTNQETDAKQEEIIGKTINLLSAPSAPTVINVIVVAQSIRDLSGYQARLTKETATSSFENSPYSGANVTIENGTVSQNCAFGRFDYLRHRSSNNPEDNIYFDEITGEVKMLVRLFLNANGRLTIDSIKYLYD